MERRSQDSGLKLSRLSGSAPCVAPFGYLKFTRHGAIHENALSWVLLYAHSPFFPSFPLAVRWRRRRQRSITQG